MKQMYLPLCVFSLCALLSTGTVQAQCGLGAAGTAGSNGNNNTIGTLAWSGTGNTTAQDGSYASAGPLIGLLTVLTTNYLTLNNFNFNIPGTYTICGVGFSIAKGSSTALALNGSVSDNVIQLATINGPGSLTLLGSNQAASGNWPLATIGVTNYGGNGMLLGTTTLTPTVVNNANFGLAISATLSEVLGVATAANVDRVSMSIYTSPPIILPITLESFNVSGTTAGNTISWTANANDIANNFVVQRSTNGTNWQDISSITASTGTESYTYTDTDPQAGPDYYRLELVNTDGTTGYSITAIIAGKSATGIHFYPNPFHDMINITAQSSFTHLSLKDLTGRTLWVKEYSGGITNADIPAGNLPQGVYFITIDTKSYKIIKN